MSCVCGMLYCFKFSFLSYALFLLTPHPVIPNPFTHPPPRYVSPNDTLAWSFINITLAADSVGPYSNALTNTVIHAVTLKGTPHDSTRAKVTFVLEAAAPVVLNTSSLALSGGRLSSLTGTHPSSHCHFVTHCSVLRSLSCPIHHSLLPPHLFIPAHTQVDVATGWSPCCQMDMGP
jgi:hypothetical protein